MFATKKICIEMTLIFDSRMENSYRNINIIFHTTFTTQSLLISKAKIISLYKKIIIATSVPVLSSYLFLAPPKKNGQATAHGPF